MRQGRHGLWFFLIERGHADVEIDGTIVDRLGPGAWFGADAVLRRVPQPATVRACEPMTLFMIGTQRFVPLVHDVRTLRDTFEVAPPRRPLLGRWARRVRRRSLRRPMATLPAPSPPRRPVGRRVAAVATVLAGVLVVAGRYHPPFAVMTPQRPVDVATTITVDDVAAARPHGRYLLTWVKPERRTLVATALAAFDRHRSVLPLDAVAATADGRRRSEAEFRHSEAVAVAVASRAAGRSGPARVSFRPMHIGGPSAGLVYALALTDMLRADDLARGRTIAATGELDVDGHVHPVGFVGTKVDGARRGGASMFIVPAPQQGEADDPVVDVRGVASLDDALALLRSS